MDIKNELIDAFERLQKLEEMKPKRERYSQVHFISIWKAMREYTSFCFAKWTDEEIEGYNKETGFIGQKCGVDCYVQLPPNL